MSISTGITSNLHVKAPHLLFQVGRFNLCVLWGEDDVETVQDGGSTETAESDKDGDGESCEHQEDEKSEDDDGDVTDDGVGLLGHFFFPFVWCLALWL